MNKFAALLPMTAGILWGCVGVFLRKLTAFGMDNCTILFARMVIGVILMLAGILIVDKSLLKIRPRDIGIIVMGAIIGNLGLSYFYNEAMNRLTLSFAAVILCTFPIFVMFFAAIMFKEKITKRKIVCMLLAIAGCVLVSGLLEDAAGVKWSAAGVMIGILSSFCYSLYSIFSKLIMQRGYSAITITFYFMLIIAIVLIPFANWKIIGDFVSQSPAGNTLFLVAHSAFTAVLPYVIYTMAFIYMDAGKAAILASLEPVAATVFGAIFFTEYPTILSICGMLLTITALSVLCLPEKNSKSKEKSINSESENSEAV